jgi:hypothetical protein
MGIDRPTGSTHGLWKHDTRPVHFSLVVDDFGIKYVGHENAEHLKASIEKHYEISCDWTGSAYCGLKLDWDYDNKPLDLSTPGYIKAVLHKFQHPVPACPEHAPHVWNPPIFGAKTQFIEEPEDSPSLPPKDATRVQHLGGMLLYYARSVYPILVMPVNVLAS